MMNDLLNAALGYARAGWPIFRLNGKIPFRGSHGFKDATTDTAAVERWWTETPYANIGLATGPMVVVDLDGPGAEHALRELAAGRAYETLTARTARGRHLYFTAPLGVIVPGSNEKRAKGRDGLDIKAAHGYVVLPPSISPQTGFIYAWEMPAAGSAVPAVAPFPSWLLDFAVGRGKRAAPVVEAKPIGQALAALGRKPAWLQGATSYDVANRTVTSLRNSQLREFLEALREIPANCSYDQWFEWGASIHDFDPTDFGLAIFKAWSKTSLQHLSEHDERACESKWWVEYPKFQAQAATGKRPRTVASVFARAREIRTERGPTALAGPQENVAVHGALGSSEEPARGEHRVGGATDAGGVKKANGHHALPAGLTSTSRPDLEFIDFDKEGNARGTTTNAGIAIQKLEVCCRKDTFHEKMLVGGHAIQQWAGDLSDDAVHMLRKLIKRKFGFDPGEKNTRDASVQLCLEHQFNPVVEYLGALAWDGRARLARWSVDYLGATDTLLNRDIGRLMLIAAVRRARAPGTKFDQIIVLEGKEGTGKSTAVKILAGEDNFSDQNILAASDKEQQEAFCGVWIHEIAELAGMRRTDVERIKQFASRTEDRARPAYGRIRVDMKRRGIFVATTNEQTYLKSETGNRRFWPMHTGRIDTDGLHRDRDQLWAEAAICEARGDSIVLAEALRREAAEQQSQRLEEDAWQDAIVRYLVKNTYDVSVTEVLEGGLMMRVAEIGQVEQNRAARVLQRLGLVRYKKRDGSRLTWRYHPGAVGTVGTVGTDK